MLHKVRRGAICLAVLSTLGVLTHHKFSIGRVGHRACVSYTYIYAPASQHTRNDITVPLVRISAGKGDDYFFKKYLQPRSHHQNSRLANVLEVWRTAVAMRARAMIGSYKLLCDLVPWVHKPLAVVTCEAESDPRYHVEARALG